MSVTIIGGAGFIGTKTCGYLSAKQSQFEIVDIDKSHEFPDKHRFADVRYKEELKKAITGKVVINLAAVHRDDVSDHNEYYSTNVDGARILCDVCDEKGINKIIFTSSVAVYGFATGKTAENGAINPFNEYGRTKALAEDVYREWQQKDPKNRSLVIIRPTVVFGEGNRGNVYNLLKQINSGAFAMIGNGKNKKSMAYVENLAAFLVECINSEDRYAVYNYVDDPDFSMEELVCFVRGKLKGTPSIGLRIPKLLGLIAGYVADGVAKFGVRLPISSIRVKKFCASSEFSSAKEHLNGFVAPFGLREGLERTLDAEFINRDPDKRIFFTE